MSPSRSLETTSETSTINAPPSAPIQSNPAQDGPIQHSFMANNVKVFFPFKPYEVQEEYMKRVVEALTGRKNAMLESPTGTGKTLSLLCSVLAWHSKTGNRAPIYYTSRTHQQLGQAAKEMKRTAYARQPAIVIGSRVHMCLNKEVKDQHVDSLINRSCRNAITKNACSYYTNYEQKLEYMDHNNVHDIEDLEKFGHKHQCCPYYASRKIAELKASLVFMPYNYLFDTSIQKSMQLKLENSVVIIDEAHNIESVLKDAASGDFTSDCLKLIIESCQKLPERISQALNSEKHGLSRYGYDPKKKISRVVDEFNEKQNGKADKEKKPNPIEELAEKLTNEKLQQVKTCCTVIQEEKFENELDKTSSIERGFAILKKAAIDYTTSNTLITTLNSMESFWSIAGVMRPEMVARYVSSIKRFSHFISLLYPDACLSVNRQKQHENKLLEFYRLRFEGIYQESDKVTQGKLIGWELKLWCLNPAVGLRRVIDSTSINGPRSIILTSGTLMPMYNIGRELETRFDVMQSFKHVIKEKQFKIAIIEKSLSGHSLQSTFKSQTDTYFSELGKTLLPLIRILPHGTLVFFPSYAVMEKTLTYWEKKTTMWNHMKKASRVFREKPKQEQNEFENDLRNFKLETKTRAVFFVVCRGKLSEGANLQGDECRTVIITGLPFASKTDARINENITYQKNKHANERWYSQQMLRALNQTIGRVIRSKDDFGLLLLFDPRFAEYKMSLSEWTRDFYPNQPTPLGQLEQIIRDFFESHEILIPVLIPEIPPRTSDFLDPNPPRRENLIPKKSSLSLEEGNKCPLSLSEKLNQAQKRQDSMVMQYRTGRDAIEKARARCCSKDKEEVSSKRPRTTPTSRPSSVFDALDSLDSFHPPTNESNVTQSSTYSTMDQLRDGDRPAGYKCCICLASAKSPYRTNCVCARVACAKCIEVLNKKECGKCRTLLIRRNFKPLLFKSASKRSEREELITLS